MSDINPPLGRNIRRREIIKWLGRGYLVYHLLVASWIVFGFLVDTRSGYGREPGVLGELIFLIVVYPLAIPALVMCGGPHNCGGSPLTILSLPLLLLTLIAAGSAIYIVFDYVRRSRRVQR